MRGFLVLLLACSSPVAKRDAGVDGAIDSGGVDAPSIGAECQTHYPPPTSCGSDSYCAIDLQGSGYHCRQFCADPYNGGCPTGYQAVFTSPGYGCLCYPK